MGLVGTQRLQQEEKEAMQLVVRSLWRPVRLEVPERKAKVFRAYAAPQGLCDNLINALKLSCEPTERWSQPSWDDRARLAGGKSAKNNGRTQVVYCSRQYCGNNNWGSGERNEVEEGGQAKLHDRFPGSGCSARRGRGHLASTCVLRTSIDLSDVGNRRWEPPLVDEDWHAYCQAIFEGVDGPERGAVYDQYKDLHQAAKSKKSGENKKARVLWAMEAKEG